jgi:hypothetical protein
VFGNDHPYTCTIDPGTQRLIISSTHIHQFSLSSIGYSLQTILGFFSGETSSNIDGLQSIYGLNPMTVNLGRLYYYLNSLTMGSMVDVLLPSNGIYSTASSQGPQICLVPYDPDPNTGITKWIDPCPEKWYNIQNFNITAGMDLYVSSSTTPNEVLDLKGKSFVVKLGLLKRRPDIGNFKSYNKYNTPSYQQQQQPQPQQQGKYVLDSTREGYFNDDPSGYRDPWDFSSDVFERQYIPTATAPAPRATKRRRR